MMDAGILLARSAWLHIRVSNQRCGCDPVDPDVPAPPGLAAWYMHIARPFVPQIDLIGVDEAILAMHHGLYSGRRPLTSQKPMGKERVQVFLLKATDAGSQWGNHVNSRRTYADSPDD